VEELYDENEALINTSSGGPLDQTIYLKKQALQLEDSICQRDEHIEMLIKHIRMFESSWQYKLWKWLKA